MCFVLHETNIRKIKAKHVDAESEFQNDEMVLGVGTQSILNLEDGKEGTFSFRLSDLLLTGFIVNLRNQIQGFLRIYRLKSRFWC